MKKDESSSKKKLYSVPPMVSMVQAIIRNLLKKTGRSLEEWIQLLRESGPSGEKEQRAWLKTTGSPIDSRYLPSRISMKRSGNGSRSPMI